MNEPPQNSAVYQVAQPTLFSVIEPGFGADCERPLRGLLDRRRLVLHADDFGLSASVNEATIAAFESGALSSASLMVPCASFCLAAAYAVRHPDRDIGIHLTLTSEWKSYRCGPVTSPDRVPSLVDSDGCFWPDPGVLAERAKLDEVERELTSQIERAVSVGIRPTHVDTHMFALFENERLYSAYRSVARRFGIPFLAPNGSYFAVHETSADEILVDTVLTARPQILPTQWASAYIRSLETLRPGVTQIIVHVGFDNPELQSITGENPRWGSAWRQRDFDLITSREFREALANNRIELVQWRDLVGGFQSPNQE